MSTKLDRSTLWSLEEYAERRDEFRRETLAHKKARRIALGPNITLLFEDFITMKYQVQEMLRTEKIFEAAGIAEELESYNPLIPDGTNWKATMLIEYADVEERRVALGKLAGVEHTLWVQVDGCERSNAIANEDMERSTDDKAAAVHFLRFELDTASISALRAGSTLAMGVDHPEVVCKLNPVPAASVESLKNDLD